MTSIPMTTEYVDVKVKIGAVEFTNEELQIDSIKISNGCYDGSVFGIGNVYIKNANITMNYRDGITKGLSMEIFFEYQGAWISFGKFVVTETPVMSGDKLSVSLESEFGQTVSTSVDFTSTLQEYTLRDIKTKIEEITGKPIIFVPELTTDEEKSFLEKTACFLKNITDYVNQSGIKTGISVRDMLSGIAILFGGNAYEDTNNKIIIKQKTYYKNSNRYVTSDYLDSNYKYSQEIYAVRLVTLTFLPWCLGLFNPPNASGRICTVNYLGEDKVSNTLLASQSSMDGKTPYDYTIDCDWVGWTSDGSTFDTNVTPGGRASACLRQGDLMYRTCDMTFVGIDFGWNIAPGNLVKVKVPELGNPIDVLCGEISYEWDGGFTTNISCNCNIESNGSYSTQVSTQASAAAAQEGRQTSLELNYANITFSNIEDSTIRGSIFKDGTIDGSKIKDSTITCSKIENSTLTNDLFKDGTIENSKIKDSTITGSKIENSTLTNDLFKDATIENSKIKDATIENSKIKDATIENSKIKDATLTGAKIQDATIGFEKVNTSFIEDLTADKAYIEKLKASIADIGYLTAGEADIKYATIASLEVVDGKIDNLETIAITTNNLSAKVADLGYLNADKADIAYAKIDFSNVGTQVVSSSMIIDGAVTNEKVANLSANNITSGEIDANKVTVSNLNASNINTGTLTVGGVTLNIKENKAEIDGSDIKDGTVTLKGLSTEVKDVIDGAIETFTKSEIPTLNNEPASLWTDNETRKKHIGDVCYVLNPASSADGYCYRFANTGTEASPSYEWVLIKDSDVTKALQDIIDINGEITGIKQFDTDISSWKTDTDAELSSLKSRTTTLETDIGTKVGTSVFNELKQTVDENSSSITSLSTTVSKKADSSTVETLTNTVNSVKQTADKNTSSISSMQTEISKKADGSTVNELSTRTSNLEQNLDGFKTTVSKTYTTKTEFDNLEIGGRNLLLNSGDLTKWSKESGISVVKDSDGWFKVVDSLHSSYRWGIYFDLENYEQNTDYTLSVDVKYGNTKIGISHGFGELGDDNIEIESGSKRIKMTFNTGSNTAFIRVYLNIRVTDTNQYGYFKLPKLEKGNKATDWSPAPEDTEKSITEVKTIAEQTADKFNWLVKSGTSSTDFTLTDRVASLLSTQFNIDALTTFKNSAENGTSTVINGGAIKAKTIKASSIDVDNLFAQDITATGTITGATLVGASVSADTGTIAGFNLNKYGLVKESKTDTVKLLSYDNLIGVGLYVTRENSLSCSLNASGIGISYTDNNEYKSEFHLSRYMLYFSDKLSEESDWSRPFELSIGQGRDADGNYVHDPYFRVYVPSYFREFECSSLKCTNANFNNSSATIKVPTTIRDALRVESDPSDAEKSYTRINNHEVQLHAINSSVVFYLSAYSGSNNKFKLYSTTGDIVDVTDTKAMTITPKITARNGIAEQGYDVVGCTVTKSGNFTCKKYRDGRLIIEFRFKTTSNVSLSNKTETYYATGPAATFPIEFTDVPSVISGLGIANSQAPFCNVTFDSVTKTGFGRYIIWTLPTISGYVIPSGSVVSATFTGRWK